MIFLIDNYDSFSYNLFQLVGEIDSDMKVIRNDAMTVAEIEKMKPDGIIISPGPGRPEDSGICPDVIRELGGKIPILGVCLGHQAICMVYGATVTYASRLMHGKQSDAELDLECPMFKGLPKVTPVARYHSLAADEATLPEELKVVARTTEGEIMAVMHKDYPVYGLQFHPESIMTPLGKEMLKNYVEIINKNK